MPLKIFHNLQFENTIIHPTLIKQYCVKGIDLKKKFVFSELLFVLTTLLKKIIYNLNELRRVDLKKKYFIYGKFAYITLTFRLVHNYHINFLKWCNLPPTSNSVKISVNSKGTSVSTKFKWYLCKFPFIYWKMKLYSTILVLNLLIFN